MLLFGLYVLSSKKPVVTPELDAQLTAFIAQYGIVPESAKAEGLAGGLPATRCMNAANWARVTLPDGSNVVGDVPVVIPLIHAHET
jgi:deoxyhypusine synthase